jgi:hypothetical protein
MKTLARIVVLAVVVLLAVPSFTQAVFRVDFNYYTDATFTTWVGEEDYLCDGSLNASGSTSDFRVRDRYYCNNGQQFSHSCQVWVDTQWDFVTCPPGV